MLELFKDEIPKLNELMVVVRQMILNEKCSLEEIRDEIADHISEHKEIDPDDQDSIGEASSTAHNAIDNLIDDLEVNEPNFKRIRDYITSYHSYNGFNKSISDFGSYLTDTERNHLIENGKDIFVSELTEDWI